MLRLAGEIADGVLLNYSPPEAIPPMIAEMRAGAEKAGRKLADVDISIYLRMCITEDEDKAARIVQARTRRRYAFVDQYNAMFERYGLRRRIRRSAQALARRQARRRVQRLERRRYAADGGFRTAQNGLEFVESFRAAGVNHPVIFPIGPGRTAERDFQNTMRAMVGA